MKKPLKPGEAREAFTGFTDNYFLDLADAIQGRSVEETAKFLIANFNNGVAEGKRIRSMEIRGLLEVRP